MGGKSCFLKLSKHGLLTAKSAYFKWCQLAVQHYTSCLHLTQHYGNCSSKAAVALQPLVVDMELTILSVGS